MILDLEKDAELRRVALALHALGPADRDWLLDRLPVRPALETLLVELAELAIPPDPALIRGVLGAATAPTVIDANPAQARALCRQLEREPATLRPLFVAALPAELRAPTLSHWQAELDAAPSASDALSWNPALCALLVECWREVAKPERAEAA